MSGLSGQVSTGGSANALILFGPRAPCAHSRGDQARRRLRATRGNPLAAQHARGRHAAAAPGVSLPLVHGPHRVLRVQSLSLRTRLSTPHSYGRCARQTRQRRARGHLYASRSSTPLQRCRCSRCAREGRLRASESMGDRGRQRHALASCLVSMPRARIHAEIRRTGAFGQRGGTRLLRHTRGGAMPLVRGPQTPKRIVAGRSRINECARPMRCRAADRGLRTRRARSSPC